MARSPREVIELYNYELWNKKRFELADELIGDTVVRHDIGSSHTLTHEEACQRVFDSWARVDGMEFVLHQVVAEGERVCIVYECVITRGDQQFSTSSIEIYRVVDGRICEVWNAAHTAGSWE